MLRLFILTGVIGAFAWAAMAQQPTPTLYPPPRTISVMGTAERQVSPDTGFAILAVQTQAETVARAVQQNNTAANRVMDAIRNLNIAGLTMRTLGFDVNPVYEQPRPNVTPPAQPRIVGYQVINRIEVRVTATDPQQLSANIGRVLDTALAAGANRVDEVRFTLENEDPVMRDLLGEATRNAQTQAAAIAAAAGVTLGQPLSLSASPQFIPQPYAVMARSAEAAVSAVPIVAGPLTVRATVNAVYEIR